MAIAYVGLGSNLEGPREQLERALQALARLPHTTLLASSPLYRSTPMGPAEQPDYVNAVARLETDLAPLELLDALQATERQQGRVRGPERWGPRTLDLDLLLYDDRRLDSPRLTLPHPGLHQRAFVLYPLHDVAGDGLELPGLGPLGELLARCPPDGLQRLDPR